MVLLHRRDTQSLSEMKGNKGMCGQECRDAEISFVLLLVKTLGGWSTIATKTISSVGRQLGLQSRSEPKEMTSHLFQWLLVSLWRGSTTMWSAQTLDIPSVLNGVLWHYYCCFKMTKKPTIIIMITLIKIKTVQ